MSLTCILRDPKNHKVLLYFGGEGCMTRSDQAKREKTLRVQVTPR